MGNVDALDLPWNVAAYAEGLDPVQSRGYLSGLPTDVQSTLTSGIYADQFVPVLDGKQAIFYFNGTLYAIDDLGNVQALATLETMLTPDGFTMGSSDGQAVHMGMGPGQPARWIGNPGTGTLTAADAELTSDGIGISFVAGETDGTSVNIKYVTQVTEVRGTGLGTYTLRRWAFVVSGNQQAIFDVGSSLYCENSFDADNDGVHPVIAISYDSGNDETFLWVGRQGEPQQPGAPLIGSSLDPVSSDDATGTVTPVESSTTTGDAEDQKISRFFYAYSAIYDGFQEAPLKRSKATLLSSMGSDADAVIPYHLEISGLAARVTHIALYRAENPNVAEADPISDWTLVEVIDVDTFDSGKYVGQDNYKVGQTFQNRTGYAVTLEHMNIRYGLSVTLGPYHFVGEVGLDDVADSEYMILRSLAYRYDTFDWATDYYNLRVKPVAMQGFMGRLYVFCVGRTVVLDENLREVETWEGITVEHQRSVVVTDRGMFFASQNQIYWHDGSRVQPIGDPILKNQVDSTIGWLQGSHTTVWPSLIYEPRFDLVICAFRASGSNYAWCFHVASQRWTFLNLPSGDLGAGVGGPNGEALLSVNQSLYALLRGNTERSWTMTTARLATDQGLTTFYEVRILGTFKNIELREPGGSWVLVVLSPEGQEQVGKINSQQSPTWGKHPYVQLRVNGDPGDVVEDLAIVHRPHDS